MIRLVVQKSLKHGIILAVVNLHSNTKYFIQKSGQNYSISK